MAYYIYLIFSTNRTKNVSYVGYTNNLKKRLFSHNNGKGAKFTKGSKWKLLYSKKFDNRKTAMKEEYKLKNNRNLRNRIKLNYLKKK